MLFLREPSFLDHVHLSLGRVVASFRNCGWRLLVPSGALGFSLFFLFEAVGKLVEQATVSQGVARSDVSPAIFEAVDVQGSYSFSLAVSLLDSACRFLLEIWMICE